ncbi:MAG: hypothetical protein ACT4PZ_08890 [Panacagrimonas sp.]
MASNAKPSVGSLWLLILAPTVWAVQFLAVYVIAAIHCAKSETAAMTGTRAVMAGIAALAMLLIVVHGVRSLAISRRRESGTVAERQRFIAFAGFLLAIVSAIATLFGTLPILMMHTCE